MGSAIIKASCARPVKRSLRLDWKLKDVQIQFHYKPLKMTWV